MAKTWMPMCLVPECDHMLAAWPLPVALVAEDQTVTVEGERVPLDRVLPLTVAALCLSEAGLHCLQALPGVTPLLTTPESLSQALIAPLAQALAQSQARNVRQMRELAQMRQLSETSLQHFERLEAYVWQIAGAERHQVSHLPRDGVSFPLRQVAQQILTDSVGLSDLAVCVETPGEGVLTARLELLESGEVVGQWRVTDPAAGWLRLGLTRALSADAQTAILRLDWQGTEMRLALSHPHPDPRFQAHETRMLALRLWKFVPGTLSPMAPEAHGTGLPATTWRIGLSALREAAEQARDPARIEVQDRHKGLVLRPAPGETLALRLPGQARPGMTRLQAMVSVQGAGALADLAFGTALAGEDPQALRWQRVTQEEPAQLHASFAPLTAPGDLVLLARLPPEAEGTAFVVFEPVEAFGTDV